MSTIAQANLPTELHVFRYKVVQAFLVSGTPLNRLRFFRPLLESLGDANLTDESHMKSYIPRIMQRENELLKQEIKGPFISLSFDGTSRLGEAVNIVGRYCSEDFQIVKRLLCFRTAEFHLNAEEFASLITQVICTDLSISPLKVVCLTRDSVLVNGAACRLLTSSPFRAAENQLCISHTLNNMGSRINFSVLNDFMTSWLELVGGRNPHRRAQALWRHVVAPQRVPGYSKVRWHSLAEIQALLAENFHRLDPFMAQLDAEGIGDATRAKLHAVLDNAESRRTLQLQLASVRDMQQIVRTTYELEGDRLEMLLVFSKVEMLRRLGKAIKTGEEVLPNVDGVLKASTKRAPGVKISKFFEGHGHCVATIRASHHVNSTLYPGQSRMAYQVQYEVDNTIEDLEEEEIRHLIIVKDHPERRDIQDVLNVAFDYLEDRITGTCRVSSYSCAHMYTVCRLSQLFNPAYAINFLDPSQVEELLHVVKPLAKHIDVARFKAEVPAYLATARNAPSIDMNDVQTFSKQILQFWNNTSKAELSEWRKAATIMFAMSPNSAACERVFSLLENMFSEQQDHLLADALEAALMMRYNDRQLF